MTLVKTTLIGNKNIKTMTLKEYIQNLNEFAENNPETLEMQVITSKDDEGNGFNLVYFTSFSQYEDYERDDTETNVVCVN